MLTFIRIEISISLVNIEIVAHQGACSLPPPPLASCVSFSLRLASDSLRFSSPTEPRKPRRFTSNVIRCTSDVIATNRRDSAFMRSDLHFSQTTIETARRRHNVERVIRTELYLRRKLSCKINYDYWFNCWSDWSRFVTEILLTKRADWRKFCSSIEPKRTCENIIDCAKFLGNEAQFRTNLN